MLARIFLALALLAAGAAHAQTNIIGGGVYGDVKKPGASYSGPGDLQAFTMWWGLRAYSAATRGANAIQICNVSDVTCENEKTNATTGVLVLGTVGSTCNNSTVICTIKTWYDQTVGGNCTGSCDEVQTTIANRCTLTITVLGSSPASAACLGSASVGYLTAGNWAQPFPFSALFVANRTGAFTTQADVIANNITGSYEFGYLNSANTLNLFNASQVTATASDSAWHVIQSVNNAGSGFYLVDATQTTANTGTATSTGLISMFALFSGGGGRSFTGSFVEGGLVSAAYSGTIAASLNSNIHTYYGF